MPLCSISSGGTAKFEVVSFRGSLSNLCVCALSIIGGGGYVPPQPTNVSIPMQAQGSAPAKAGCCGLGA